MRRSISWLARVGIRCGGVTGAGVVALALVGASCGETATPTDAAADSQVAVDSSAAADGGGDAGATADASTVDAAVGAPADGGEDAAAAADASLPADASIAVDSGIGDAGGGGGGGGGGGDAGGGNDGGGQLALPKLELLNGAQNLGGPVIDASPDDAGNVWAATPSALYIRRAGEVKFRRYTNVDGLHIDSVILSVAGGGIDDGYVGLLGIETGNENDAPAIRDPGKAEHVKLNQDGTITSKHYWDIHTDVSANFWITRSAYRLLYLHDGPAAGHLFMGGNHGITHIFNDQWGDHVHVEVYYMPEHSGTYGLWNGLAVDPTTGGLWTCGKNSCGLQTFNADPRAWVNAKYIYAFTVFTNDHALEVPHGYRESFVGAAATPDGTAWFLSSTEGLAAWKPNGYDYQHIHRVPVPGLNTPMDVAADPDGTVWIADAGKLLRLHPNNNAVDTVALPVGDLRRLYLDRRASPRALYISTGGGLVIYRGP